jgi:hypothetical protein
VPGESGENENVALSVPLPAVAAAIALGIGIGSYLLLGRGSNGERTSGASNPAKKMGRKFGLMTLVTLIENDTTRKIVVAGIKAMARRG